MRASLLLRTSPLQTDQADGIRSRSRGNISACLHRERPDRKFHRNCLKWSIWLASKKYQLRTIVPHPLFPSLPTLVFSLHACRKFFTTSHGTPADKSTVVKFLEKSFFVYRGVPIVIPTIAIDFLRSISARNSIEEPYITLHAETRFNCDFRKARCAQASRGLFCFNGELTSPFN